MTTYPITLPIGGIATAKIRHRNNVAQTRSVFTGERQIQRWPGERFEFDVAYKPRSYQVSRKMAAALASLWGNYGTLLFGDPDYLARGPLGVNTGTPVVDGNLTPTHSETLPTRGWTPSTNGILKAGDMFQRGTSSQARLHMVTEDANSDSSGHATLSVWPRLRSAPVDGEPLIIAGAKGVFELIAPAIEYSTDQASVYLFSFGVREAF